jgi:hypothetical protein
MVDRNNDIGGLDFTVGEPKEKGSGNSFEPLNEDTLYAAKLADVTKENAPFGEVLRWSFELLDDEFSYEYEGEKKYRRITGTTSLLCNPKTKLYAWYVKLLGREPKVGEKISLGDIIGTECKILVKNVKAKKADNDGNYPVYSNVDRIIPGGNTTEGKPAPKAKPAPKKEEEVFPQSQVEPKADTEENSKDLFDDVF